MKHTCVLAGAYICAECIILQSFLHIRTELYEVSYSAMTLRDALNKYSLLLLLILTGTEGTLNFVTLHRQHRSRNLKCRFVLCYV